MVGDSSKFGLGAALEQLTEGRSVAIVYVSRFLNLLDENYSENKQSC